MQQVYSWAKLKCAVSLQQAMPRGLSHKFMCSLRLSCLSLHMHPHHHNITTMPRNNAMLQLSSQGWQSVV